MKSLRRSLEDDAAMSNTQGGLTDFLNHISRQPYHPTLVDRYLCLAFELSSELRRDAMEHLNRVLMESNPSLALRSNYQYKRYICEAPDQDREEEVFVLQLIQSCFRELGRYKQAGIVGQEIARIVEELREVRRPQPQKLVLVRGIALNLFDDEVKDEALDAYEQLGQELFFEMQKHLGSLRTVRHQKLAIEKIIHGLDALYEKAGNRMVEAVRAYGRNPLIWMKNGDFRPKVANFFLDCRVFQMGQDQLTALRMRMVLEMLIAYYDQRALALDSLEKDRDTRLRLLAEMVNIFLDAGVTFPSYVMGAS
ncbi:MAG TPA: hypothetical protein VFO10_03195 [Oligoflexus sp.]|uniref:hypothetical protein n=1 Tax=Oligoflexus sp. TaxID=1971216 RepID=UPI002D80E9E6|nr:hypothetical protein [Oligoflexus sp.]HET9236230.1 hypothetical protein [Oligoflexus sp.]